MAKIVLKKSKILQMYFLLLAFILLPYSRVSCAETEVICLDTSGSMKTEAKIDAAKEAVIREIERAKPGDKIWIVTFDTYARLLGKLEGGESPRFVETKRALIQKLSQVKAMGRWTHLEQAVMKAKTILLDGREIVGAKILIFSDGISDPDPSSGVPPVNLEEIATLLPQNLGINVYLISFKDDIVGFFKTETTDSKVMVNPSAPHIKGVPIDSFTSEKIENALKEIRKGYSKEISIHQKKPKEQSKRKELPKTYKNVDSKILYVGPLILAILAIFVLFIIYTQKNRKEISHFILETEIGDEKKEIEIDLPEGKRKSVGSSGDIQVSFFEDLPPILFSLQRKKGQTWLIPQDAISLNGLEIINMSQVNSGDLIGVRDKLIFRISERGEEGE